MSEPTPERQAAFAVLRRTFEGDEHTERAFREEAAKRDLAGRARAQAQRLAFGAVQRRGTADTLIERFRKPGGRRPDPKVMAVLRLGIFELLFSDGTPGHAAVSQAVDLARAEGMAHAAGFVNALLRRVGRERETIERELADDSTPGRAAFAHSAPEWLAKMWFDQLGPERARSVLAAANRPPRRHLRINTARIDREEAIRRFSTDDTPLAPVTEEWPLAAPELVAARGGLAGVEAAIEAGLMVVQSAGSAAVVEVLDPQPDERILDLCAGPGIKSGQIAVRVGRQGDICSVELVEERAGQVAEQMMRLGLHNGIVIEADARDGDILRGFQRVLVDAPCSDLGALDTRPDARWRKSPATIDRVTGLQREILDRAVDLLDPGRSLVYSTCTISREENTAQAAALAERHGLLVDDLGSRAPQLAAADDSRFLQLLPDRDHTTGFFIARFLRP